MEVRRKTTGGSSGGSTRLIVIATTTAGRRGRRAALLHERSLAALRLLLHDAAERLRHASRGKLSKSNKQQRAESR
jgi:hypothetical protein